LWERAAFTSRDGADETLAARLVFFSADDPSPVVAAAEEGGEPAVAPAKIADSSSSAVLQQQLPDSSDQEAVQKFFLQQDRLGQELLASGDLQSGAEHLALAVAVCANPHSILCVYQQTLPPQAYQILLHGLEVARHKEEKMDAIPEWVVVAAGGKNGKEGGRLVLTLHLPLLETLEGAELELDSSGLR
jgi:hypothetical protein